MPTKKRFLKRKPKLKYGKNGKPLCRFCEKLVSPPRRTFCSKECVHEWKLRSSGSYARYCVFKRDKGICYKCGLDCHKLKKQANQIRMAEGKDAYKDFCKSHGIPWKQKSFWQNHHKVAVAEFGGQCGLENLATICYPCHKVETAALIRRLARKRKVNKKNAILLPPSSLYG